MTNATTATATTAAPESSQVDAGGAKAEPPPPPAPPSPAYHGSKVYKSGPLFLSSKGIGWTSWKKRWFVLTQTSLVFYRSDPNAGPSKSGEVNLTLGGIDLNSSGSVVVKEDKKLITVLFSDGRDGRAFTLKAETLEDLFEWKAALEEALSNAPKAAVVVGQNGLLKNDQLNAADASSEQSKDKQSAKSLVVGRPVLLALEDIDGTPSFLEKALRFLEEHGVKTEGILRQAADVEDVERRIQEYEKGKNEFSPEEDAHVIADCIKYVLRELPSYPVPASCCKALLEACRTERSIRVAAMRSAICETFPEPNRRLLQRILMMMQTVASNKAVNRMSISAVAACMAPLLLRPLLAGDCDIDHDFDMGGDGSVQLLQAAAAANHAQAIVITLLEEYDNIFGDVAQSHEPYTDSEEESGSESEEISDDEDDESFDEEDDMTEGSEYEEDDEEEFEHESSRATSDAGENIDGDKVSRSHSSGCNSPKVDDVHESSQSLSSTHRQTSLRKHDSVEEADDVSNLDDAKMQADYSESLGVDLDEASVAQISAGLSHGASRSMRRPTVWGRAAAKKNLSMESIDLPVDDEAAIQKLESVKTDLETRISDEATANSLLQDSLGARKHELHERRQALQKEVGRLMEQLQKEMELRKALEAVLRISQLPSSVSSLDDKMKAELEIVAQAETDVSGLKKKAGDLECQLYQQREQNSRIGHDLSNQLSQNANQSKSIKEKKMDGGQSENFSTIKHESGLDRAGNERDKKREVPSSSNVQGDVAQNATKHGHGKPSSKAEGTNSALSKLTNRLNFLKERRSQIANEIQNMDKPRKESSSDQESGKSSDKRDRNVDRRSSRKVEAPHPPPPNLERGMSESFPAIDINNNHNNKPPSKFTPRTFSR